MKARDPPISLSRVPKDFEQEWRNQSKAAATCKGVCKLYGLARHDTLGLVLVAYHARIAYYHQGMFGVTSVWSAETDKFISTVFIFFVMWTGLAKWPIYPWYKKRQNRKKREAKAEAATDATEA